MRPAPPATEQSAFRHEAFYYRDLPEFLDDSIEFIRTGLIRDEAVLVAVGGEKAAALQAGLDSDAAKVEFVPMERVGRNPGRIISVWHDFVDQHAGRPVRGIGEPVWPERDDEELLECQQHEHLLNVAFERAAGFTLRCPYDASALSESALAEASRSHPYERLTGRTGASAAFDLAAAEELLTCALPPTPTAATRWAVSRAGLSTLRTDLAREATAAGLSGVRQKDAVLVASELMANSLQYSNDGATLAAWSTPERFVCEVYDNGVIVDPLVGRRRPDVTDPTGRGLWIAHELADLVQLRSGPYGTHVRASFDLPG